MVAEVLTGDIQPPPPQTLRVAEQNNEEFSPTRNCGNNNKNKLIFLKKKDFIHIT